MSQTIKSIDLGGVNAFLIETNSGFILVDTGFSNKRSDLDRVLAAAGCKPGDLKLIILTHGDSDHAGNAAYLCGKYGAKTAIHADDAGMVERCDMSWNRKPKPDRIALWFRVMTWFFSTFSKEDKFDVFKPDLILADGQDLSDYGLDAGVVHLPGHSKGSIGVLTPSGDLICGDLIYNLTSPSSIFIDDLAAYQTSIARLKTLPITNVYPGHGKPFLLSAFIKN
jgi:hydroxyacylglutathione hydrolase